MNNVSVFAPASVANISCGFDVLGVCLDNIGDTLHIQETSRLGIEITEIIGQDLPLDPKKNVASVAGMALLADHNSDRGFEIKIEKGIKAGAESVVLRQVQLVLLLELIIYWEIHTPEMS